MARQADPHVRSHVRHGSRWAVQAVAATAFLIVVATVLGGWDSCSTTPLSVSSRHQTWAVGTGGTIVHTGDAGRTWMAQVSGTTADLHGVDFVDTKTGWAVGFNGTILHTSDGGVTWTAQTSGTFADLWGVSFVDANTGWVAGFYGTILATSDGGATWRTQLSGDPAYFRSVSFADAQHGCAVGFGGPPNMIYVTSDGGATWSQKASGADYLYDVAFVDATHAWAVGSFGAVVTTSDGGATWTPQSSGVGKNLTGVAFAGSTLNGVIVGALDNGASPLATVLTTADGGAAWAPVTADTQRSPATYNDISFSDAEWGWAVGETGEIYATRDGGLSQSWSPDNSGTTQNLYGVSAVLAPETPALTQASGGRQAGTEAGSLDDLVLTWQNGMTTTVYGVQNPRDAGNQIDLKKTQVSLPAKFGAKACFAFQVTTSLVFSRAEVAIPASALPDMGVPAASASKLVAFSVSSSGAVKELVGVYGAGTSTSRFAADTLSTTFILATDTTKPVATALAKVTVKKGKKAKLRFKVADGRPSAGTTITIAKGKKIKATLTLGQQATNKKLVYSYKCKLSPGKYSWTVKATDRLGNVSKRVKACTKALVVTR